MIIKEGKEIYWDQRWTLELRVGGVHTSCLPWGSGEISSDSPSAAASGSHTDQWCCLKYLRSNCRGLALLSATEFIMLRHLIPIKYYKQNPYLNVSIFYKVDVIVRWDYYLPRYGRNMGIWVNGKRNNHNVLFYPILK